MEYKKVEIANIDLELRTEVTNGECSDTEVSFSGNMYVAGNEKDEFLEEFKQLISKYKI